MTEFSLIATKDGQVDEGIAAKSGVYAQSYSLFNISWALGTLISSFLAPWLYSYTQSMGCMLLLGVTYSIICCLSSVTAMALLPR